MKSEGNRQQKAVALQYEQNRQSAPKVIAKGKGRVAEKIIEKAKEYDIPLFANPELADSLLSLDIDSEIPPELYQAVVDVFIWLMQQENRLSTH